MRASRRYRGVIVGVVCAVACVLLASRAARPATMVPPGPPSVTAAQIAGHDPGTIPPERAEEVSRQSIHDEPLWVTLARLVNFAILVGVLVYYLRSPIASYLSRRSTEIRSDLTKAAETREAASRELASIEQKMRSLPGEIEALKTRGAEEIAAEEARIHKTAETERERLLEQTRREIDQQLRASERELRREAAALAVRVASDRIKATITDADQARLVDRYLEQMQK